MRLTSLSLAYMVQPCSSFDRRSIFRHYGTKGVSKLASSGYILHM